MSAFLKSEEQARNSKDRYGSETVDRLSRPNDSNLPKAVPKV